MPVVKLDWDELEELTGGKRAEIEDRLPMMGADVERTRPDGIDVEFFPDRPDLFSIEGVARALRNFLCHGDEFPEYQVAPASLELEVEPSVSHVRPFAVAAVVRNVELGESGVTSMMALQENLHNGPGRGRKRVAIGLHDLSAVEGDLVYGTADPSEVSLVPLERDDEMTLRQVAKDHPKGEYADIVKEHDEWPIIRDDAGIISFPPVINAERTRVTSDTTDLLVECTGTDEEALDDVLAIVVSALVERGGTVEAVRLTGTAAGKTPDMEPETWTLDPKYVRKLLGLHISDSSVSNSLDRMCISASKVNGTFIVKVPPYRADIMHPRDLVEDVAIGFGYDEVEPEFPDTPGIGRVHPVEQLGAELREVMTGLGFLEVMTLTLGNEQRDYRDLRRKVARNRATLENPISQDHTMVRTDLLASLLDILTHNRHRDLPQHVFEYGEVVRDADSKYRLAALSIHDDADFTEARSLLDAVLRECALEPSSFEVQESEDPAFFDGRRADVYRADEKVGVFGEIHPEVLETFGLLHPVVALEMDAEKLTRRPRT